MFRKLRAPGRRKVQVDVKCVDDVVCSSQEEALCRGVYAPQDHYSFPPTRVGETSTLKVNMRNNSLETHAVSNTHTHNCMNCDGCDNYPECFALHGFDVELV